MGEVMDESGVWGLPLEVETVVVVLASGVLVPAITSLLAHPGLPRWVRHWTPIVLSALAAVFIVALSHPGELTDQIISWLGLAATITGTAQAVYAVMPAAWKRLEEVSEREEPPPQQGPGPPRAG